MSLKSIVVGILSVMLLSVSVKAQITYNSADNKQSDWADASTWTRLPASETWAPASPGNPTNSNCDAINIYGYVRVENGGLTVNNANPVLTVYDTLWIDGNVTLGSGASMNVTANGILVITGNLTLEGNFNMVNGGNVVVKGNLNVTNGSVQNNTNFYVLGSTTASGGGKVNGCDGYGNPGGCQPANAGNIGNATDLANENPDLADFVGANGVMPVTLLSFSARLENEVVLIKWSTSREENFSHFEIEQALDDLQFQVIGRVNGLGYTTEDVQRYSFIHTDPVTGTNYYRLKAVDVDGTYEYFAMVKVVVTQPKNVYAYANPSNGQFINIAANFNPGEGTRIFIYKADGTLIDQNNIHSRDERIDFANQLQPGLYLIKYATAGFTQTLRFVVK